MKKKPGKNEGYTGGLTLAEFAKTKGLPVDFLKSLGLADFHYLSAPAVRIPYRDENGEEVAVRFRLSMDPTAERFKWRTGAKPCPYGLQRLDAARDAGHITLVEGESDSQTLWLHEIPALGLPGANSWKDEWAPYFEGIETIYVVIEPDKGGAAMLKWVGHWAMRDRVRLVRLQGAKDPSELYLANPKGFRKAWAKAVAKSQPWSEFEKLQSDEDAKSCWEECKHIAEDKDILGRFGVAVAERGAIGVSRKAKVLYLALTSRLLDRVVSMGLKGPSSGGKSYLVDSVLAFFPPEAYYVLTAMSDKALAYSEEPLRHRFVVLYEAAALENEWAAYFVRSLLSEGRIIYETVEKGPDGAMRTRRIEREGPTGLLTTTTAIALHPENETRYFSLRISDTPEQTKRIIQSEAHRISGLAEEPVDDATFFRPWRALQGWLACSEHRAVVPFAPAISRLIPPVAVRLRRDFSAVMSFVQAHAILHQATCERDDRGRIIATLEDYNQVRVLIQATMAEASERTVPDTLRETVRVVEEVCSPDGEPLFAKSVSIKMLAQKLGIDRSAASRRAHDCLDRGYLETTEPIRKGQRMSLRLGEPLPDDQSLLPTVEQVREQLADEQAATETTRPDPRKAKKRATERVA